MPSEYDEAEANNLELEPWSQSSEHHGHQNNVAEYRPPAAPSHPDTGYPWPQEWRSTLLKPWVLLLTVLFTVLLLGGIITLCVLSTQHDGFASVTEGNEVKVFGFKQLTLGVNLTWTFIPVLVFQLYALLFASIVSAAGERQPYVELRRPDGSTKERSIQLDYPSEPAIWAPWKAFRLKHFGLAGCFSLALVGNVILTALAAYLFVAVDIVRFDAVTVGQPYSFTQWGLDARSDLVSVMEVVAATRVYGAVVVPWTMYNQSFLPLDLSKVPVTSNFTAMTESYSVQMDCRALETPREFVLERITSGWAFLTSDRGCETSSGDFTYKVDPKYVNYIHTYSNTSCLPQDGYSRLVVVAALNANASDSVLTNKTAVSCSMKYERTRGILSLNLDHGAEQPSINHFTPTHISVESRASFATLLETGINYPGIIDPTAMNFANNFGRLILGYAQKLSPDAYFTGDVLRTAMEDLYPYVFAIVANRFLVVQKSAEQVSATTALGQTRLKVVLQVAGVICGILTASAIMLVWIWFYTEKNQSILYEEPKGLLGAAAILQRSELVYRMTDLGARSVNGKIGEEFARAAAKPHERWVVKKWDRPWDAVLVAT